MNKKDLELVERIYGFCNDIDEDVRQCGNSMDNFLDNRRYQYSCAFALMQIGELSGHLSDGFIEQYSQIPWHSIRGFRNRVAHEYGNMDDEIIWATIEKRIPELRKFCAEIIQRQ